MLYMFPPQSESASVARLQRERFCPFQGKLFLIDQKRQLTAGPYKTMVEMGQVLHEKKQLYNYNSENIWHFGWICSIPTTK